MRILGVDYGLKRVGLSLSDETGVMAFPLKVLPNDKNLFNEIKLICDQENVKTIVVGDSRNNKGEENPIMKEVNKFIKGLRKNLEIKIETEPEFMTSIEAERIQGKNDLNDASAATLILNSFLARKKHDNN